MTVLASAILARVRTQLMDELAGGSTVYRWTDAELLRWLSDGQRTIVSAIPRATATTTNVTMATGSRQTLPANAFQLISVVRNMGSSGATPGQSLQRVERLHMDIQFPTWPSDTGAATAKLYLYDISDPTAFHVYPPHSGSNTVEVVYSVLPPELTATTDALTVRDIYQTPLFDYIMYRAHLKDSDYAAGQGLAGAYLTSFTTYLSSMQTDAATNNSLMGKT